MGKEYTLTGSIDKIKIVPKERLEDSRKEVITLTSIGNKRFTQTSRYEPRGA